MKILMQLMHLRNVPITKIILMDWPWFNYLFMRKLNFFSIMSESNLNVIMRQLVLMKTDMVMLANFTRPV